MGTSLSAVVKMSAAAMTWSATAFFATIAIAFEHRLAPAVAGIIVRKGDFFGMGVGQGRGGAQETGGEQRGGEFHERFPVLDRVVGFDAIAVEIGFHLRPDLGVKIGCDPRLLLRLTFKGDGEHMLTALLGLQELHALEARLRRDRRLEWPREYAARRCLPGPALP